MAKRSHHSFVKRQKEIERKQKAQEKLARRQEKRRPGPEAEEPEKAPPRDPD